MPEPILAAISDAVAAGTVVSIVTGRMRKSALRYAELCNTNGPTISYQGAVTTAQDGSTDIHSERLPVSITKTALKTMRDAGAHINFYADDEIYVENENEWARDYADRMDTDLQLVSSLDSVAESGPTVVMAVDEPARISGIATSLRSLLGTEAAVTQSLPHFCEVGSTQATKAAALSRVCATYSFEQDEVIAIGDGEGDVSMIQWAGLGIAAGNAHPSARAAAQLLIPGPEHNGVADLVQKLLRERKLGG